ncbi:MAG: hypothetical protein FWC45_06420 [Treponema sp.]|nr:hypothetical protein [Treponema sp.]
MKRDNGFFTIFLLLFLFTGSSLFAFGGSEVQADKQPVNTEYVLCVTAFDSSALPPARQLTGGTVTKSLVGTLKELSFRFRGEKETAYYRDYAWAKARSDAAKALAAKRNERDLLVYKGDQSWKYRKNLKALDDTIAKLEADVANIDAAAPVVEAKPAFRLTDGNLNGSYPAPPAPGDEYSFCTAQKADAFLTGTLSEYHGRTYLIIKIYTVYTRSYSYEDSILFSAEDLNGAMGEISGRLAAAVSGTLPAGILVHATPPEALVLIDGSLAGQGEIETRTRSPGTAEVSARADNYLPASVSLELKAGELAELFMDLTPLSRSAFELDVPDSPGSRVYLGGLYAGKTPLVLQLPGTEFTYISVETAEGNTGSVVYRDNSLVKGSAQFTRSDGSETGGKMAFNTATPVSPEEKRVDKARRGFYGAYGAFWIVLPAALITAGIAKSYVEANNTLPLNFYSDPGSIDDYNTRKKIYDNAVMGRNIQIGANIVWGAALGVTFFQIFRYLLVSGGDAAPIVKAPAPERTEP